MKRFYLLCLLMALLTPWVTTQADELTVNDGTTTITNEYVPLYGYYADTSGKSQFVVSADAASDMAGGSISGMSFYASSDFSFTAVWEVRLMETNATSVSTSFLSVTNATLVYTGPIVISGKVASITFDNAFDYSGDDNLLVEVSLKTKGNYSYSGSVLWYGVSGQSRGGSGSSPSSRQFVPKTTFTYTPGAPPACPKPKNLEAALTLGNGSIASLSWTAGGSETAWKLHYSTDAEFGTYNEVSANGSPIANLEGLTAEQPYYARVKAVCGANDESDWSNVTSFTPSDIYSLTVNEGTSTNSIVPVYGINVDHLTLSQFVIPAADLESIKWAELTELTFFSSSSNVSWGSAEFEVYVSEINSTTISALADWTSMTKVMNAATLSIKNGEMIVTLDVPYQYKGGNLLIGFNQTATGSWKSASWYGISAASGASMGGYDLSASQQNFLPKMKIIYVPGEEPACLPISNLEKSNVTAHTAELSWTENGEATAWQICLNGDENNLIDANTNPFELTELTAETAYAVKVRANCGGSNGVSEWSDEINFTTKVACEPLASISISNIERHSMTVNLIPQTGLDLGNYDLVYSTSALDNAGLEAASKTPVSAASYTLDNLERDTKYYIYVRANCGSEGPSTWVSAEASTKALPADCSTSNTQILRTGDESSKVDYVAWGSFYKRYHTQQIYTASELTAAGLSAGYISKVAFQYALATSYTKTVTLYMGLTMDDAFATTDFATLTAVSAPLEIAFSEQDQWYEIELADPFYWDGISNVIVGALSVGTNYPGSGTACFYGGTTSDYRALYNRADSSDPSMTTGTKTYNRADVRFTICPLAKACPEVLNLKHVKIGEGKTEARIEWEYSGADYLSGFEIVRSEIALDDPSSVTPQVLGSNVTSVDYDDLEAAHTYYIYVRAICKGNSHDDGESEWASLPLITNADCPAVVNLSASLISKNEFSIQWEAAFTEQVPTFAYYINKNHYTAEELNDHLSDFTETDALLVNSPVLDFGAHYYIYVVSLCDEDLSEFAETEITTLPECLPVINLTATRVAHNLVELTWDNDPLETATQWVVGLDGEPGKIVTEPHAILFGLDANKEYTAFVKTKGTVEGSAPVNVDFKTTVLDPCAQVGNGTNTEYGPVCGFYGYERNGYIFTAADGLTTSGKIESLSWYGSAAGIIAAKIYLKNTTETAFSTSISWNELISDATLVWDADVSTANGWYDVDIEDFIFTGNNLMILVASNKGGSGGASVSSTYFEAAGSAAHIYSRKDSSPADDAAISSLSSQGTNNHLPNTKFCFEQKACPDVTAIAVSSLTNTEATVSWEPMGTETAWNVFISDHQVTDFSGVTAETVNDLSKHFTGLTQGTDYYVYIQPVCSGADFREFVFTTIATCPAMTALQVDFKNASSATVSWTDPRDPNANNYTVAYAKTADFDLTDPATFTSINVTNATSALLPNLKPETEYSFAVMADCGAGDISLWSNVASFKTECEATVVAPWSMDFEDRAVNAIPSACWDNSGSTSSDLATNPQYIWGVYENSDNKMIRMYNYYVHSGTALINTPGILIPAEPAYELTFDYAHRADCGDFIVKISTDNGVNWADLSTLSESGSTSYSDPGQFTSVNPIDLSAYAGNTVMLQFFATANYGQGAIFVDNISIHEKPDCEKPTGLALNDVTSSGASFSWDKIDGGAWKYAVAPASDPEPADNAFSNNGIVIGENISVEVSGLNDNTDYIFYLRQDCGSAMSESVSKPFHTKQAPASVPYSTDFESGNDWMFINGSLTNAWVLGEATSHGGTHALYISNDGGATNAYTTNSTTVVYATKLFQFETGSYSFQYDWIANGEFWSGSPCDYLRVLLVPESDELTAGTLFTGLSSTTIPTGWKALDGTQAHQGSTAWETRTTDEMEITAGNYNVVLLWRNDGSSGSDPSAAIDNFIITKISCPQPTALSVPYANVFYNRAIIGWTAGEETEWNLQYKAATDEEWISVPSANVTNPYTLDGLTTGTTYQVRVQAICGVGNESKWTDAVSFTPTCKAPTLVAADITAITSNSATIAWTANGGEDEWIIQYKATNEDDWTIVSDVTTNPYTLTMLSAGKTYQVKVSSAYCENYSYTVSFNTECENITAFPWSENFNGLTSGIPNCWDNDEFVLASGTMYKWASNANGHDGECVRFNSFTNQTGNINYLKTPTLEVSQALVLSFWYKNPTGGDFSVFYAIDGVQQEEALFSGLTDQSSWQQKEIVLPQACIGQNVMILFKGTSNYGNGDAYIYLDDVEISIAPDCERPTDLVVSDITTTGATFAWTAGEGQTAWQICLNNDESNLIDADSNPFVVSTLTAASTYSVKVRAKCGSSYSEWSNAISFGTEICNEADKKAIRYELTDQYQDGWNGAYLKVVHKASNIEVASLAVPGGQQTYTNNGTLNLCCGEEYSFVWTSGSWDKECSFVIYDLQDEVILSHTQGASISAGVLADYTMECPTCFKPKAVNVPAANITSTAAEIQWTNGGEETAWQICLNNDESNLIDANSNPFTLTELTAETTYSVKVRANCGESQSEWSEAVNFTTASACATPDGVAASEITATSATITWNAYGLSDFNLRYSSDGINWIEKQNINTPYIISNELTQLTEYQVQVQATCNTAVWSNAANFETKQQIVNAPYATDFESGNEWQLINGTLTNAWVYGEAAHNGAGTHALYISNNNGTSNAYTVTSATVVYAVKLFHFEAGKYSFTYDWKAKGETSSYGTLYDYMRVFLVPATIELTAGTSLPSGLSATALPNGWIALDGGQALNNVSSWQTFVSDDIDIEAGNYKVVLLWRDDTSGGSQTPAAVDNFSITTIACPKPKALNAVAASGSVIDLSWQKGDEETEWDVQYRKQGESIWNDAVLSVEVSGNNCSAQLVGLDPQTTYEIQVRANCGADQSEWIAAEESTLCGSVAMPFVEDFNGLTSGIPECWDNNEGTTASASFKWTYYATGYEGHGVRFNSYSNSKDNTNFLKTPAIVMDAPAALSFWFKNPTGGDFSVYYTIDGGAQTPLSEATGLTGVSAWTKKEIEMPSECVGHEVVIIFKGTSNYGSGDAYIYLDEISVERAVLFLDDHADNSAILAQNMGQTLNVQIGRTFTRTGYDTQHIDHYNTICLPFSLNAEQLAASPIATDDIWRLLYARVDAGADELLYRIARTDHIDAGVPYLIGFPARDEDIVNPIFENVTISATEGQKDGDPDFAQFCGILKPEPFAAGDQTKQFLYTQTNTLYWWNGNYDSQLYGFRAFFLVNTNNNSNNAPIRHGMRSRIIKEEQVATGVENINGEAQTIKRMENGMVVIIRNGVKYSIDGQVISK